MFGAAIMIGVLTIAVLVLGIFLVNRNNDHHHLGLLLLGAALVIASGSLAVLDAALWAMWYFPE